MNSQPNFKKIAEMLIWRIIGLNSNWHFQFWPNIEWERSVSMSNAIFVFGAGRSYDRRDFSRWRFRSSRNSRIITLNGTFLFYYYLLIFIKFSLLKIYAVFPSLSSVSLVRGVRFLEPSKAISNSLSWYILLFGNQLLWSRSN